MENISKTLGVQSNYRERFEPLPWDSIAFAKVVFLDMTNPETKPRLYQLKDSALSNTPPELLKSTIFTFTAETFLLLGEVSSVDKNEKKVVLDNQRTVSYVHLVTVYGHKIEASYYEPEFSSELQILVEALKVKPIVPNPYKKLKKEHIQKSSKQIHEIQEDAQQLLHPYIQEAGEQAILSSFGSLNKRFCNIQI